MQHAGPSMSTTGKEWKKEEEKKIIMLPNSV
jgi:hypothetical protein